MGYLLSIAYGLTLALAGLSFGNWQFWILLSYFSAEDVWATMKEERNKYGL